MNLAEILARMAVVRADIEALAAAEGDLTPEQTDDWNARNTEWDELDAARVVIVERNDRLAALRSTNLATETGDGAEGTEANRAETFNTNRGQEDIYNLRGLSADNDADGNALRDRALAAIESWRGAKPEWQESAVALVDNAADSKRDRDVATHVLRYGSPAYRSAFTAYLRNPNALALLPDEQRAALAEGATTTGGFMVPVMIDPSIILTNAGISNPFRQISTVKSITTQSWKGITSAGVTAEWTAEAAQAADASPTVGQPVITPVRADAYVQASFEVIEDTDIANDLPMLFADARDRLEGAAFATGTGSTQPFGIVTELGLVTASRVNASTNGAYGAVDVFAVDNSLPQRHRANASWVANKSVWNLTRQFAGGSGPQFAFWTDFGGGRPPSLIGYSAYESSAMFNAPLSTATASNDDIVVLGDFRSGFYIVDRIGMAVAYNPLVIGANARPTGEAGWFAYWRVGARAVNADAFRMLRV